MDGESSGCFGDRLSVRGKVDFEFGGRERCDDVRGKSIVLFKVWAVSLVDGGWKSIDIRQGQGLYVYWTCFRLCSPWILSMNF
jgi:hypothetical protein